MGTPAIGSDGSIYVPAGNFLYALNPDGSEKWMLGSEKGLLSLRDISIDDKDTIYAVSDAFSAFTPDGMLKWQTSAAKGHSSSVAIDWAGRLCFMRGNTLCAVDAEGGIKWEREIRHDISQVIAIAPVIGSGGTIYTCGNKRLHGLIQAFEPDGTSKWTFEMDRFSSLSMPAVDDLGNLYFGELSKNFYSLASDGRLKWIFKTEHSVSSAPAIGADHTVYFGCTDGSLYALDPNGELKWRFHTNGPICSSPAIDSEGNIYFASRDRNFYCVNANGSPRGVLPVTAGFGSPVIGADGTIYLVDVGYLYAIRGLAPPSAGPWPMKRHDAQGTARLRSHYMNAGASQ
jgi:outer membrane protein assembly factor BamB